MKRDLNKMSDMEIFMCLDKILIERNAPGVEVFYDFGVEQTKRDRTIQEAYRESKEEAWN